MTVARPTTAPAFAGRGPTAALVALAVLTAILLILPVYRMGLWLEQPNEGWNGVNALHAFSPALYPPRGSFIINNYLPLWAYLTGALAIPLGDPIFPGRVVALLSFAMTAVALYALARRLELSRPAALAGALTFAATIAGLLNVFIGLSEPQFTAHALVTAGSAIAVGARTRRQVALAAALIAIGLLFK